MAQIKKTQQRISFYQIAESKHRGKMGHSVTLRWMNV